MRDLLMLSDKFHQPVSLAELSDKLKSAELDSASGVQKSDLRESVSGTGVAEMIKKASADIRKLAEERKAEQHRL